MISDQKRDAVEACVDQLCGELGYEGEHRRLIVVGAVLILMGLTKSVTCHKEPESTNDQDDADWEALRKEAERIQYEQERAQQNQKIENAIRDYQSKYQEAEKERRKREALQRWNLEHRSQPLEEQKPLLPIRWSDHWGCWLDARGQAVKPDGNFGWSYFNAMSLGRGTSDHL